MAEKVFPSPVVSQEVVAQTAERLLAILLQKLSDQAQTTSHLILEVRRLDMPVFSRELVLSSSTTDYNHLWSLLNIQLERLDMAFGIEAITLRVNQSRDVVALPTSHIAHHSLSANGAASGLPARSLAPVPTASWTTSL